ncbi:MAG: hypothetical protein QXK11_07115 [Pyrobaculum sp.]|uniref:hypothetical protein n=1 Tax=Pyrobaculum sp. TaxID=2004705 RepID=UPI00317B65D7
MGTLATVYRKNIKYPGETVSFVIEADGARILKPVEKKRSKTGAHGYDIYTVERPVYVITYEKSNSGRVSWSAKYYDPATEESREVSLKELPMHIKILLLRIAIKNDLEISIDFSYT